MNTDASSPTTEPATAIEPQLPAEPADPDTAGGATEGEGEQADRGNREAARYRRQLRDTEAERDALRERITGYERAEAERLAADVLTDPADLWAAGVKLDDLRSEDGALDAEKVTAAVAGIAEARPHWRRPPTPRPDRRQGGGQHDATGGRRSWSDALRNR
ncbi:hypothetical protein C5E45_28280 [Nocardia nova]|uniref:Scaffolding protein n=1 Tax=Nocardia nova TaxID=37330 RepID=A0A2S6AI75_9NOCA|nr:hypothetical protein [Nocardia nova]PPJ24147.1 hypothetical protein C5E41_22870 [Nocardia nova]PPJ34917.1 hypothetical protein C5E45_28280 [Nocardia nova]